MSKLRKKTYAPLLFLLVVSIIGVMTASINKIALVFGLGLFVYGFIQIWSNQNDAGQAHKFAALFVGAEVFWRMSYSGLPWDFSKYVIILYLMVAMYVERGSRSKPYLFLLYGLLFLPAIFVGDYADVAEARKRISFNLLGELILIISMFYFYNRKITMEQLADLGRWIIYGVMLMSMKVLISSPNYAIIEYGKQSSFAASGGFGPNQVSVIFGLGILVLGFFIIKNIVLFKYKLMDIGLLILFAFQGLFTLSRGGLMAAVLALLLGLILLFFSKPVQFFRFLKSNFLTMVILLVVGIVVFIQANAITGGAISKRYFNVDKHGEQVTTHYTSHRNNIFWADIALFSEYWETGVGPGESMLLRKESLGGEVHAAHIEFSRILSEHGILGLIALIILLTYPVLRFFKIKNFENRFLLIVFMSFVMLTMSHNALRLSIPGFFYGLVFVILYSSIGKWQNNRRVKQV